MNISKCSKIQTEYESDGNQHHQIVQNQLKHCCHTPTIVPEKITFESVKNTTFFDLTKLVAMVTKLFQLDTIFFIILKDLTSYENIFKN